MTPTTGQEARARILVPHDDDCGAMAAVRRGSWDTPWWMPGKVEWRDAAGRKHRHGSARWHVVECNDPDCEARAIVSENDILASVPHE